MRLGQLLFGSICFLPSVVLLLLLSLASASLVLQCCPGAQCFVGVFLVFLAHTAIMCVFLPRRRFGGRDLVKLGVLVVFFSSHSSSCVMLRVLFLRVRQLLHIFFRVECVAKSASLVHI